MKRNEKGITLVALVVTIVVLLILAGITIMYVMGDNGVFGKAKNAKEQTETATFEERLGLAMQDAVMERATNGGLTPEEYFAILKKNGIITNVTEGGGNIAENPTTNADGSKTYEITSDDGNVFKATIYPNGRVETEVNGKGGGSGNGGTTNPPETPDVPDDPKDLPLASTVKDTNHETTKVKDTHGNEITVPKGFKVVEGSTGEEITVQNGVVIEDSAGNQFVWIPVGEVTLNDGTTKKEIKLGRYTFDETTGKPTMVEGSYQYAYTDDNLTNYTNAVTINSYYKELSIAREGVVDNTNHLNDLNTTAKNLQGFVNSVRTNGGYYLARYEASYGSGYDTTKSTEAEKLANAKPLSKPSMAKGKTMSYTTGTLWNNIKQLDAAKVARNMYVGNKDSNENTVGVESDLVNSYAWDTAIVYITEMGNTNFANKKLGDVGNITILANTGSNSRDKFCNVYDMVANTRECTTEYSTYTNSNLAYPCVNRGGSYNDSSNCTAHRHNYATNGYAYDSFRLSLWIK